MRLRNLSLVAAFVIVLSMLVVFGVLAFLGGQANTQNVPYLTPAESTTTPQTPTPTIASTPVPATEPTQTPAEVRPVDYNAEAQRIFNQAVQKIDQTRNVSIPQVNLQVVSKEWSIQTWGVSTAQADVVNIQRQENIYKALLMIPQNASLYQATVDWAGYFMAVTQSGTIYIVQENFNITNTADAEATMAHELTHILQSYYNIPQYYYSFDSDKARAALTEGDASFTASYVKNQTLAAIMPSPEPKKLAQNGPIINNLNGIAFFPSIPDSVSNLDYFPYSYGEKFLQALYSYGGWETVNQAYQNPPNSTEQILHPEKYLRAELPEPVTDTAPSEGNWTKAWSAQYGEFFIQNMLSTNLTRSEAEKAAAGWGGDRLSYYESPNNQYLITWNIKWDSYNDAGEFFLAFNNYMRNAGAQETQFSQWQTNQVNQEIIWNQDTNTTLIVASTDIAMLQQFR